MSETPKRKFYITGGRLADGSWRGDDQQPIVGHGTDRIDALVHSGITVWEEAEYLEAVARHPSPPEPIHVPTLQRAIAAVKDIDEFNDIELDRAKVIAVLEALRDTRTEPS